MRKQRSSVVYFALQVRAPLHQRRQRAVPHCGGDARGAAARPAGAPARLASGARLVGRRVRGQGEGGGAAGGAGSARGGGAGEKGAGPGNRPSLAVDETHRASLLLTACHSKQQLGSILCTKHSVRSSGTWSSLCVMVQLSSRVTRFSSANCTSDRPLPRRCPSRQWVSFTPTCMQRCHRICRSSWQRRGRTWQHTQRPCRQGYRRCGSCVEPLLNNQTKTRLPRT